MRKIILFATLFLIFFSSLSLFSQAYHKFLEGPDKYWDCIYRQKEDICFTYYRIAYDKDTLINTKLYKQELRYASSEYCPISEVTFINQPYKTGNFVREDTVNKRVYVLKISNAQEELLYDFNWKKGDTLPKILPGVYIIDSVYNIITTDGKQRKKYTFKNFKKASTIFENSFIEGLGGVSSPLNPITNFETTANVKCIKDKNGIINGVYCNYEFVTFNKNVLEEKIKILYSIDNNIIRLSFNENKKYTVALTNIVGSTLLIKKDFIKTEEIDISKYPSGIYFISIYDELMNLVKTEKIVKK